MVSRLIGVCYASKGVVKCLFIFAFGFLLVVVVGSAVVLSTSVVVATSVVVVGSAVVLSTSVVVVASAVVLSTSVVLASSVVAIVSLSSSVVPCVLASVGVVIYDFLGGKRIVCLCKFIDFIISYAFTFRLHKLFVRVHLCHPNFLVTN